MSEDADSAMERGREWLETVLCLMSVSAPVKVLDGGLEIDSTDLLPSQQEVLIGEHGVTLDALQYLANTLLNLHLPREVQHAYTIDLAGYRQRRNAELEQLVAKAIDRVRSEGGEYEIHSLSAAERRQIHTLLSTEDYADLETFSRGKEPHRCLVVSVVAASSSQE